MYFLSTVLSKHFDFPTNCSTAATFPPMIYFSVTIKSDDVISKFINISGNGEPELRKATEMRTTTTVFQLICGANGFWQTKRCQRGRRSMA